VQCPHGSARAQVEPLDYVLHVIDLVMDVAVTVRKPAPA